MGNSLWRLQTALNYLAQNTHGLDRMGDVEVVVTDWGSEIPLHTVLQLSPAAAKLISFVVVPPALVNELQKDSPFSEVHALNVAARRANGHYIGRIDQDILVGKHFFSTFFQLYEGIQKLDVPLNQALLFANRRRIPYRFADRCPPLWAMDRFVQLFGHFLRIEQLYPAHLFYFSFVGLWLIHRNLWYESSGYDEQLIYMNEMESDMIARLLRKYEMVNLGKFVDYDFYHLEHYHPLAKRCPSSFRKVNISPDYARNPPEQIHPNGQDWGLAKYSLQVVPALEWGNGAPESLKQLPSDWQSFRCALLSTGAQITLDTLILALMAVPNLFLAPPRLLFRFSRKWGRRAAIAWETISGQPLISWPRLLVRLWKDKTRTV